MLPWDNRNPLHPAQTTSCITAPSFSCYLYTNSHHTMHHSTQVYLVITYTPVPGSLKIALSQSAIGVGVRNCNQRNPEEAIYSSTCATHSEESGIKASLRIKSCRCITSIDELDKESLQGSCIAANLLEPFKYPKGKTGVLWRVLYLPRRGATIFKMLNGINGLYTLLFDVNVT